MSTSVSLLPPCSHSAGDVLMVQPQNLPSAVEEFTSLLGLNPDQCFMLEQNDPDTPLPPSLPISCTVRHLATHYLDFQSVPRRSFFELLAHFTSSELEREKLQEFNTAEGQVCVCVYVCVCVCVCEACSHIFSLQWCCFMALGCVYYPFLPPSLPPSLPPFLPPGRTLLIL